MPGPPPVSLTARDLEVLDAFKELLRQTGLPPTVRELGVRLGLRNPQSVQRHLDRLVAAGRLQRSPSRRLRALTTTGRGPRQAVPPPSVTARDLEVLDAFNQLLAETGLRPSIRELSARLGLRAPQSARRHVDRLVAAGRIQHPDSQHARASTAVGRRPLQGVRHVPLVESPWHRRKPDDPLVPLPEPDLAPSGELVIAMRSPSAIQNGPHQGDLLYCVPGRAPSTGDVVVIIDKNGQTTLRRWRQLRTQKDLPQEAAKPIVVVGWTHRAVGLSK